MALLNPNSAIPKANAPSPTPSNSSTSGAKRKRPTDDAPTTIYSQPIDTGTGSHIFTQVTYAIEHLRNNDRWMTFQEITDYLNVPQVDDHTRSQLETIFRRPEQNRIEWNPKNNTYRYKPKYDIRNAAQLKGYLQNQRSAQGLAVRDLKDGWRTASEEINAMGKRNELLVTTHKKDGSAKTAWINDPSLMHTVDDDFKNEFHKIQLPPNPDDLRSKLIAAGLKPSSAPREIVIAKPKEKKKKAPRRGGKQTNTHMASILKDYSHKRK
ncbi:transcription initiation factor IIE, beta subunit [Zopfia rhizophila CBS 207.26]|uniref:Transcription initiation factor IIE subunit beta n=1 Tax=Zopfia rhizophila CBS 207.26 TaxID=1314779 RepID=A0A6A6EQN0_9PEZI|nr:transcription initiation factor IIE, beta subunit [Zopfia rhizophila CBS 207.26]